MGWDPPTTRGSLSLAPRLLDRDMMTNADAAWRSELPCAEGTASLVLGAGDQSFLTFISALDRSFVHGEAILIKHHPLRPWLLQVAGTNRKARHVDVQGALSYPIPSLNA